MSRWARAAEWAAAAVGAAAFAVFAVLAQRHVGDSYFLADQVDQLQNFESLLALRPEGLWGSIMSGTEARSLGPVGAIIFGLPVHIGLGIDAVHAITSLLIAAAAAAALVQLAGLNRVFAFTWFAVFASMRVVWWNAAMFWVCTLLLPCGLLLLALSAACLRRPTAARLALLLLVQLLALQVHLVSLVGVPVVLAIVAATARQALSHGRPGSAERSRLLSRRGRILVPVAFAAVLTPYAGAELMTSFHNTRAMWSHLNAAMQSSTNDGRDAARQSIVAATDPAGLFGDDPGLPMAAGAGIFVCALAVWWWKSRQRAENRIAEAQPIAMLLVAAIAGIAGQAVFFRVMARPLNGLHYVTLLAPFYAVGPAALLAGLMPSRAGRWHQAAALAAGAAALLLVVVRGPVLADRYAEKTEWSYRHVKAALDTLCQGGAQSQEGPGLVDDMNPSYDSVLRYLLKRRFTRCRYDPQSPILLVGNRNARFDERLERADGVYQIEQALPPGIARYRRVSP